MATKAKRKPQASKTKLDQRKQEELLGILLIVIGFFTLVALFTYVPTETIKQYDTSNISNGLGFAGIYISHVLVRWTIGYPIFILPFLLIAWGGNRLFDRSTSTLVKFTVLSFILSLFISVSFALHDTISAGLEQPEFLFSGIIGGIIAQFLITFFGEYGAVVVLFGLIMAGVLLASTITFSQMYEFVSDKVVHGLLFVKRRVADLFGPVLKKVHHNPRVSRSFQDQKPQDHTIINRNNENGQKIVAERPVPVPVSNSRPDVLEQLKLELAGEEVKKKSVESVQEETENIPIPNSAEYELPKFDLLQEKIDEKIEISDEELQANANLLEEKLADFGLDTKVVEIHPGPVITRYEMKLAPGIKVSRITALADDLAMALRALRIRIVAPIPGKSAIGIEIPNLEPELVNLREIVTSPEFQQSESPLSMAFGKTISGKPFVTDLAKMPHLLVAGSTGSGKSVCLNTIIASLLFKSKPTEVQIVLIDPKRLELSTYAKLWRHHLNYVEGQKEKVATTAKSATAILKSLEKEMENRYELLAAAGVRNIHEYNERAKAGTIKTFNEEAPPPKPLVYLVLIVDELADLMLTANATKDIEEPIARLTQMSRAVGIHLVLATQRPSVDVITGVIKANFPARIAFQVASKVDSRTILDMNGAEKLLGRGDMLFLPPAKPEPQRLHNAFISLNEIENVIDHIRKQPQADKKPLPAYTEEEDVGMVGFERGKRDTLFKDAMNLVVRHQQGSVSLIQRRLKVGYSRAARLIDELEDAGVVGPFEGSKAREVLVSPEELEGLFLEEEDEE
jgi:DNA segregation ATPase FtsK/SpoIIIE, S-DNA-T family